MNAVKQRCVQVEFYKKRDDEYDRELETSGSA